MENKFEKIILVDKPMGWTSFDVVAKLRGHFSKIEGKKVKVGHAGTLDPFATGLLIVLLGAATKNQDQFMKLDKEYQATLRLGATSSTADPEGEVTEIPSTKYQTPNKDEILNALRKFEGAIEQVPPIYSAIKVDGQRAYKLARAGKTTELKPRKVTIYSIELSEFEYPILKIRTKVSSGTYIRTLAEDIGKELGTGAYLTELRRTKIGEFSISDAKTIEEIIKT